MRPPRAPIIIRLVLLTAPLGACGDDAGGSGTAGAGSSSSGATSGAGTTAAATTTDGVTGGQTSTTTTDGGTSGTTTGSTGAAGSTTSDLTGGAASSTGPACVPGELGCECSDGACAGGLACIDGVCVEPPAVCGDGQLDPPEMCEPGEVHCNPDCTYEPGLVFWTDIYSNKGMDTMTTGAWGRTAAFDADDVPYVGDARFGEWTLGAGGWVLRYDHDTGAVDWQTRFTDGPWYIVSVLGLAIQPDGSPVFGGQVNTGPEFGNDAIFGQVTPAGALGWGQQLKIVHTEWLIDTATLADGSVVGVGARSQDPDLPDRGWIAKVDATGQPQWQIDLDDGTEAADGLDQVEAIDGDVVVFGCCEPGGLVFLRRYDAGGAEVWTTPIAGLAKPFFGTTGLDVDAGGTIHAAWITAEKQLWFGEFTADGDEVSTFVNDDPQLAGVYPRGLGVTPQGKLVVAGSRTLVNSEDAFYGVFDATGALLWSETVAGTFTAGNDAFEDVAIDSRGLALIAGRRHQAGGQLGVHEAFVRLFAP